MKIPRKLAVRIGQIVALVALVACLAYQPGRSFADRAPHLREGMTWAELDELMGCPSGNYQVKFGKQIFTSRAVCIAPGGPGLRLESWYGDDGEVFAIGTAGKDKPWSVSWTPHRDRPRMVAQILGEEVNERLKGLCDPRGNFQTP